MISFYNYHIIYVIYDWVTINYSKRINAVVLTNIELKRFKDKKTVLNVQNYKKLKIF